jgi:peptidoglycan/LPS O-acetylase OafA/YrhL
MTVTAMTPATLEFSSTSAILYVAAIYVVTFLVGSALVRLHWIRIAATRQSDRYGCLDGLRGVLAVGVFIHHSFTAYGYFVRGEWAWSSSPIFNHLGQTTVALFFMLTAFLFSTKLLNNRAPMAWTSLYVGRMARLFPAYALVVIAVASSALALSDWPPGETSMEIGIEVLQWMTFVIFGRPDINAVPMTWTIIAGVNWSLKYEWAFYFSLPLVYWPLRRIASPTAIRIALAVFLGGLALQAILSVPIRGASLYLEHFACGIAAALIHFDKTLRTALTSRPVTALALPALAGLLLFPNAEGAIQLALTTLFFLATIGGYSCFGLLRHRATLWLGDISYGVYLIHGLLLFWTLHTLDSPNLLAGIGLPEYTLLVAGIGSMVILAASISYLVVEKPAIEWGRRTTSIHSAAGRLAQLRQPS